MFNWYVAPWSCETRHFVPLYVHTCSRMTIKLDLTWLEWITQKTTLGKITICIQYTCTVSHALIKMLKINVNWTMFYKKQSLFAICIHNISHKLVVKWGTEQISLCHRSLCVKLGMFGTLYVLHKQTFISRSLWGQSAVLSSQRRKPDQWCWIFQRWTTGETHVCQSMCVYLYSVCVVT